jgi:hypothetical protein
VTANGLHYTSQCSRTAVSNRTEGSGFITVVDVPWNENWNGTEQRRHFRKEGDRPFIESTTASIVFPGTIDFRRIEIAAARTPEMVYSGLFFEKLAPSFEND